MKIGYAVVITLLGGGLAPHPRTLLPRGEVHPLTPKPAYLSTNIHTSIATH